MFDGLKSMLKEELYAIEDKGNISKADLEDVEKLSCSLEKLCNVEYMEDKKEYSNSNGNWSAEGSYKRDRMGRYSRNDGMSMMADSLDEIARDGRMSHAERETVRKTADMLRRR